MHPIGLTETAAPPLLWRRSSAAKQARSKALLVLRADGGYGYSEISEDEDELHPSSLPGLVTPS